MIVMRWMNLRVRRSSSAGLISHGTQAMPPLAPPKGMSTSAVFQVISAASARTS